MSRKVLVYSSVLILALAQITSCALPLGCVHLIDSHVQFNLNDLQKNNNYEIDVPEQYKSLTPDPTKSFKLVFNFCTKAQPPITDCEESNYAMGYLYTDDKTIDQPEESSQLKNSDYKTCMPMSNVNTSWEYLKATDDSQFSKVINYLNQQVEGLKGRLRRNRLLQTEDKALGIKAIATNID